MSADTSPAEKDARSQSIAARIARLDRAVAAQKAFIHRVPDPDTRERAEAHLITLVQMRETIGPD